MRPGRNSEGPKSSHFARLGLSFPLPRVVRGETFLSPASPAQTWVPGELQPCRRSRPSESLSEHLDEAVTHTLF